ncbi:MAG TPA: hypothetical protein VGB77_19030 [Abditibacteriaceae bacterium]|jgi:hypothetical protein
MNQEMLDKAGPAIIAVVVLAVLVAGYVFMKRSDTASQPFGVAPPGVVQQAMQQGQQKAQQQPRSAAPNAARTNSSPGTAPVAPAVPAAPAAPAAP